MPAPINNWLAAEHVTALALSRWWTYQKERFPLFAHGPLILAFSASAVCFSMLVRGTVAPPSPAVIMVAFVTALLFFLQLRIADEFKDFEDDRRYRPYRPVPRGLVSLKELAGLFVLTMVTQWLLAWWLHPMLTVGLLLVWFYLALMSKEFFVKDWLKAHPLTYMWTHMLIMPLIDLYATACDWLAAGHGLPEGLHWFLWVSFFNGMVIEIGRKLRAPEQEETGVETYTALWGRPKAVVAWLAAMAATAACAAMAADRIDFLLPVAMLLGLLLVAAAWSAWRFLTRPVTATAKWFEPLSGVWTLSMYLSLGVVPLLWRLGS